LSHNAGPFCSGYFGDGWGGVINYFPGMASNLDPPNDLCFPSS
jgi:hypothetical protein